MTHDQFRCGGLVAQHEVQAPGQRCARYAGEPPHARRVGDDLLGGTGDGLETRPGQERSSAGQVGAAGARQLAITALRSGHRCQRPGRYLAVCPRHNQLDPRPERQAT